MKIKAIEVKNLFSYDDFNIEFNEGNIAVIVGPNNAGKTNLFRVLEFLKDVINDRIKSGKEIRNYLRKENEPAKIIVDIKFDENERHLLKTFVECFIKLQLKPMYEKGVIDKDEAINKLTDLYLEGQIIWEYKREYREVPKPYYKISMDKIIKPHIEILRKDLEKLEISKLNCGKIDNFDSPNAEANVLFEEEILENLKKYIHEKPNTNYHSYLTNLCTIINKLLDIDINDETYCIIDKNRNQKGNIIFNGRNSIIKTVDIFQNFNANPESLYTWLNDFPSKHHELILLLILLKELHTKELSKSSDGELLYKLENLCNYIGIDINKLNYGNNPKLLLYEFILKLFDKAIIKFEEVRGYPEKYFEYIQVPIDMWKRFKSYQLSQTKTTEQLKKEFEAMYKIPTYGFENENYFGNEKDLAKYLFYLKNAEDLSMRKKYYYIKKRFRNIFSQENIDFDVVNYDGYPRIVISHNNSKQLPIENVGSGIFEVLNILAVVIGASEKVILLDEPALHLHPVYQKKLLKDIFEKLNENGNNQIIIITHSPYLIDTELLPNTFRFYKDKNETTQLVSIYEKFLEETIRQKIKEEFLKFENDLKRKININLARLKLNELKFLKTQCKKLNILKSKKGYLEKQNKDDKYKDLIEKCNNTIDEFCNGNYKIDIDSVLNEIFREIPKIKKNYKVIDDEDTLNTVDKINLMKMFEENEKVISSLFANGVILVEGLAEFLSLPILIKKLKFQKYDYPLEKFNIEIINVGSKDRFSKYMRLMDSLNIPYCIVCDGDTAFNFYTENNKKSNSKYILSDMPKILKDIKDMYSPEWLNNSYIEKIKNELKLPEYIDNKQEIDKYIKKTYEKIAEDLRKKSYIYACPYYDWTDFLKEEFKKVNMPNTDRGKAEVAYLIAMQVSKRLVNEKLEDLRNFIENFIDECIIPKSNN